MTSGIYLIRNAINGKRYVGSARHIENRWCMHRGLLRRGTHHNPHLQAAWAKHGEASFTVSVLEVVMNHQQLVPREQHYIDSLHPEYNKNPIAGSRLGTHHGAAAKAKLAVAGRAHSAESEARRIASLRGRTLSAAHKESLAAAWAAQKGNKYALGYRHTAEALTKIAAASRGRRHASEVRARIGAASRLYRKGRNKPPPFSGQGELYERCE